MLALAAPAMAEQPTERLTTACFKLALMWDQYELDHPAYKSLDEMHNQLVEQCMLIRGLRLRTDCTAKENSIFDPICYERILH